MASQARVWWHHAQKYVIAFKPQFNKIVLAAMKSEDPVFRRDGFKLFGQGLRKVFKPTIVSIASNSPQVAQDKSQSEMMYSCIFDPLCVMTKRRFEKLLALGTVRTDTITAKQLAEFSSLVPHTRAALEESYDERFERNEEVLASLLQTVLHLYDPEAWPIQDSLPSICSFFYRRGAGFTARKGEGLRSNLATWNQVLQTYDDWHSRCSMRRTSSASEMHQNSQTAAVGVDPETSAATPTTVHIAPLERPLH